jgi:hypothetical protein
LRLGDLDAVDRRGRGRRAVALGRGERFDLLCDLDARDDAAEAGVLVRERRTLLPGDDEEL